MSAEHSRTAAPGPASETKPDPRRRTGRIAEEICARRLEARGWRILARNWRIRIGELDLVARDGRTVVIVEVKAARGETGGGPFRPVLRVGFEKQQRLRRLASAWLAGPGRSGAVPAVRFDVVGVTLDRHDRVVAWDHIEDAF